MNMLDLTQIKAISLDLDDTLWPVWPVIERAEKSLDIWLQQRAPMTAVMFSNPDARLEIRKYISNARPEFKHDLSALRRESIREALQRSGEDPLLAEEAFKVFFAERNRVTMFEDAVAALEFLSQRFPIVALSNGNADIEQIGIHKYFKANISAQKFGVAKPDPRIFHAAAEAVGTLPANVLHIGDDAALDVLGALKVGMQTVWLNRASNAWEHIERPHMTVTSLKALCEAMAD